MRIIASALVFAAAFAVPSFAQQADKVAAPPAAVAQAKPVVQIAILLDTSSSMDGLIDQAKTQLWKIVNEFAKARLNGQHPDIKVALYQYGTPSLGVETGYIRQLVPLTDDLDKVSEQLFKLKTDGGDEFCGAVIKKATEELDWSSSKDAYKAIFIAGNEPFTQGPVDFHGSCKQAIAKGILVNTIFCGNEKEGVDTFWKEGATLADGSFITINQDAKIAQVIAPQDKEIAELGTKLNSTYVGYGHAAATSAANQVAQDKNAAAAGGRGGASDVERSITKAGSGYTNATWDLVDAVNQKKVELKEVAAEDLPKEMQGMDEKGREAFVKQKTEERAQMQQKIKDLAAERDKYIAEQTKAKPESTLDQAILSTVHSQATKNGMTFETPEKKP